MKISEVKEGMRVRISKEDHHFYFRSGTVLSVFHETAPDLIYIRIDLDSGDKVKGFQPEHLMAA
jgi:hypothetical protein